MTIQIILGLLALASIAGSYCVGLWVGHADGYEDGYADGAANQFENWIEKR